MCILVVRAMTRSADKARAQPAGVEGVVASMADPSSLPAAFHGIDNLFLLNALGPGETAEGLAAAKALTTSGFERQVFPLVGPDALTGGEIAAVYGRLLGRAVHYVGDDVDAWAEQAKAMMPECLVDDLRIMFEYFVKHGLVA
jgi:uncharacterized protein YbjT (DUF2867 family)